MTLDRPPGPLEALLTARPISTAHWGLERMHALLAELDHPERGFESLHVAGTNGKGSTAALAAGMLRAAGHRTGVYTSPHLSDVRERFLVDDDWVEERHLQEVADRISHCGTTSECSYFEVTTALAFSCFAEVGVDFAVIETGLGGRLDATNVLQPMGTAITSVGLDHTELLGSTIEEIAGEKAGILKAGVPACVGRVAASALETIRERARAVGAPVAVLGEDASLDDIVVEAAGTRFSYRSTERPDDLILQTALPGAHQADNAALALLLLDRARIGLDGAQVREGIAGTRIAGRFEIRAREESTWVLDIAHNPDSIDVFLETLVRLSPARPWVAVVGILGDKAWGPMLDRLATEVDAIILTQPASAPVGRRWDVALAEQRISRLPHLDVRVYQAVAAALDRSQELAGSGTILITGSSHTVGEARAVLEAERPA